MYIGQAALNAVVVKCKPFVIDAGEVQSGGVKIIGIGGVHRCFPSQFVSGAVADSATDAADGHPSGEGWRFFSPRRRNIKASTGLRTTIADSFAWGACGLTTGCNDQCSCPQPSRIARLRIIMLPYPLVKIAP